MGEDNTVGEHVLWLVEEWWLTILGNMNPHMNQCTPFW